MVAANENGNGAHLNGAAKKKRPDLDAAMLDPGGVVSQPSRMPGWDGMPFRGAVPFLKNDDGEHNQPQIAYSVHADVFDMSDEEDRDYYAKVWQMAANGYALISADERQWVPEKKSWCVFLRWATPYTYVAKESADGQVR